ncbi:hypothetical protein [Thermopirellula anaerolimosa]
MDPLTFWSVPIQAGFAAFCAALLTLCAWLVVQIVRLSRQTMSVVESNTEAITRQIHLLQVVVEDCQTTRYNVEQLRLRLEARPCLAIYESTQDKDDDTKPGTNGCSKSRRQ